MKLSTWGVLLSFLILGLACRGTSPQPRKRIYTPNLATTPENKRKISSQSIAEDLTKAVNRYSDQTGKAIKTPELGTLTAAIDKGADQALANALIDQAGTGVVKTADDKTITGGSMWAYLLAEISQPGLLIPVGLVLTGLGVSAFVLAVREYSKNVYLAEQELEARGARPAGGSDGVGTEARGVQGGPIDRIPRDRTASVVPAGVPPAVADQRTGVPTDDDFSDLRRKLDLMRLQYDIKYTMRDTLSATLGSRPSSDVLALPVRTYDTSSSEAVLSEQLRPITPPPGEWGSVQKPYGTFGPAAVQLGAVIDVFEGGAGINRGGSSGRPLSALELQTRINHLSQDIYTLKLGYEEGLRRWEEWSRRRRAGAAPPDQTLRPVAMREISPEVLRSAATASRTPPVVEYAPDNTRTKDLVQKELVPPIKESSNSPGKMIATGALTIAGVAILGAGINSTVNQSLSLTDADTPEKEFQRSCKELEEQWILLKGQEAFEKDMKK
ncbi:MAG: hypothetical protein KA436_09610 [Oligoflexales bacterium]|nr:hypothetical protein [Oligoflexales bacterium]